VIIPGGLPFLLPPSLPPSLQPWNGEPVFRLCKKKFYKRGRKPWPRHFVKGREGEREGRRKGRGKKT